jgi:FAD/FMN-containing dehydrogenase
VDERRLYRGRALAVALPRTVEQVARVVGWCNEHRLGLVPQGGNTGYCGGATPDESGRQLLLSLRRLNRIRAIDADNFSITAEAGCVLASVQQAADALERFFPLSLGSEGSCQIGGNLATNAGGLNVVRYGMARDLLLGIEAVLPDGQVFDGLKSLRKDNTGYDLKSLLVGSEGTLGVITAATLKLWPKMRSSATAFVALATPENAVKLLGVLRAQAGERLSSFELLPRIAIELTTRHISGVTDPLTTAYPWYILCELSSAADEPLSELLQQTLADAAERSLLLDAALATSERVRAAFWRLRETVPEAQRLAGSSLKHDISVPVASLPAFISEASLWVQAHVRDGVLVCYGHAGDGNLHFNISGIDRARSETFLAQEPQIRRAIHDLVAKFAGSISAEHGIGRLKREELRRYASPVALGAMRAIKQALDPNGIMNPGKLL